MAGGCVGNAARGSSRRPPEALSARWEGASSVAPCDQEEAMERAKSLLEIHDAPKPGVFQSWREAGAAAGICLLVLAGAALVILRVAG